MKSFPRLVLILISVRLVATAMTVHEWGTFTSVSGSDGEMLPGLHVEEERLPAFVKSFDGFSPLTKGFDQPVQNVTIKMETPVLYFYADRETPVEVSVRFHGGSISQWYPDRSSGEALPPIPTSIQTQTKADFLKAMPPIDFGVAHEGSIQWKATVLAPTTSETINTLRAWETPQWPRARVAGANLVKVAPGCPEGASSSGPETAPAVEGFLFYRGIGNFELPLEVKALADGRLILRNKGSATIPYLLIYEGRQGRDPLSRELFNLTPGERRVSPPLGVFKTRFTVALEDAGLSAAEASALLSTWKESYFERPGLRVFWIVPRPFTDKILPLSITPIPDKIERVLVGRIEVLTPAFEAELIKDFAADYGQRWSHDRYFLAYRERARQLGVVLKGISP